MLSFCRFFLSFGINFISEFVCSDVWHADKISSANNKEELFFFSFDLR